MIILDTNVVSGLMKEPIDPVVLDWFDRQVAPSIWTTTTTLFELRFGIERLAPGRRREALSSALRRLSRETLERRILAFDEQAALETAILMARRQGEGRSVGVVDSMIAGIARARRATLATRNVRHFEDAGIELANPWGD